MKSRNLVAILGAIALSAAFAGPASAVPLHGFCNGTSTGACSDNGSNTPLGNSTQFGLWLSSAKSGVTGTLILTILLPDNYTVPAGGFSFTGLKYPNATATELSGPWTSGTLASYLGISGSPNNPISAYLPTTQGLDAGATGYYVFQAVLSDVTLSDSSSQLPEFDVNTGLGLGSYIIGFFNTGSPSSPGCIHGKKGDYCATANSGALLVNSPGTPPPPPMPEPGTLALLAGGLAGLGFALRRRAKRT